ncbi:unnamed protein product [Discula destructiva]
MATSQPTAEAAGDRRDGPLFGVPPKYRTAFLNYLRIFTYASALDKIVVTASCLAAFGSGLTMPALYILFGRLTGAFTGFYKQSVEESKAEFIQAIDEVVLQITYVFFVKLALTYLANLGLRMTSLRISSAIRVVYLRSLFSLPISTLDMIPTGQTAAIITTVANNLQLGISEKLSSIFASTAMVLGSLIVAVFYDWRLTLATSLGLGFIAAVYYGVTPKIAAVMAAVLEHEIQASSVAAEALNPHAVRMLAACGAESKIISRYSVLIDEAGRKGKRLASLMALQNGLLNFGVYATFALAFWVAFQMYLLMAIDGPEPLIVVLLSTMLMATCIGQMSAPISALFQATDAVAVFHTIIDFPKPAYGTLTDVSLDGDVVLEKVNFAYPARPDVKILDDLSLTFPNGKITAIVGPSGSGKSTIVSIIERWYEFNGDAVNNPLVLWFRNGAVTVSGTKFTDIDPKWWRSQIGLVQQENILFDTSIYKNVEYGLVGTQWEHAEDKVKNRLIRNACKDAFADDFISRLPDGYHTAVGQGGVKISGGQRQRLAIARAIVKQPKILILDEATSSIDVRSERIVQAALDRASKGRTTIVIAHRLGTIKKADNIVLLRKGQVVQQGTHASLMSDVDGAYHRLVAAQNLDMHGSADAGIFDEKTGPLSPSTTWTDETLVKESVPSHCDDSIKGEKDQDDEDMMEGRVRVLDGTLSSRRAALWAILSEQARHWLLFSVMLLGALGAGAATPVEAYLFSELSSLFSFWDTYLKLVVNFWVEMMVVLAVGVGLGQAALGWSTTKLSFAITISYRKEYFKNMLDKPAAFFDDEQENSSGALTSRLSADPTQLQQFFGITTACLVASSLNLVGCVAIAFAFGWKLTIVALITTLPVVMTAMIYRMRYERDLDRLSSAVFAESARFACESIAAIRTAVSLTLEGGICHKYEVLLRDHLKQAFRKSVVSVLLFSLSDSIPLLCMAFVLWYGAQLLGSHEYTPFQYLVVYIAVLQGGMSAGQWLSLGPNISQATTAAERILASREDDENDDEKAFFYGQDSPEPGLSEKSGVELEFQNVSFHYPTRAVPVLSGFDMKIEKGQFAAIVGPSGSGKSTIISLLERFYDPQQGQILHNGVEIGNGDLAAYRRSISLVAQEPSLFSGTIRQNITLGIEDAETVHENATSTTIDTKVHQAALDAGIHEFIVSLPEGYNTPIGTGGLALSGGQKQRISLARALIRQPSLLLLDEATSSLDSETEARVQAVLDSTKGVRTMVVVAHRLATVQNADIIFVLGENGKLVEQGDHASLVANRGVYYSMCQLQTLDSN